MRTQQNLKETLQRIDRRGYKAYRDIQAEYQLDSLRLAIDHVQADPFAAPSKLRTIFERDELQLPEINSRLERVALEDFLVRRFRDHLRQRRSSGHGSGKSGAIQIDAGRQEVIERTACRITSSTVEMRLSAGLPAQGRNILGRAAETLLLDELPDIANRACRLDERELRAAEAFIASIVDSDSIRDQLRQRGLVAFVADGAVLPRESGVSDRPMRGDAVPFRSPESLRVELDRPNAGPISGMGIPEGITLIVGGGFHGKSTLLEALARGVYEHIPEDGRELVVARPDAVKIRAEDGRSVAGNDLTPFINRLPLGRRTDDFSSENASGSTSQAANILEATESGSRLLLMDEDTCATNFMIRDDAMRELVPDDSEPITPFIDRVRQMHDQLGISTILVMGGAGDYFGVADTVIWMNEYEPRDVSDRAISLVERRPTLDDDVSRIVHRIPEPRSVDPTRRNRTKTRARGTEELGFGDEQIDLRQVEQLVDPSQTRGIAEVLVHAGKHGIIDGKRSISEILDEVDSLLNESPIDVLSNLQGHPGDFARPRRYEVGAALNRLRSLRVSQTH
jgi:predicted ABC-class ATPase